jgi:hypothetical protein
VLPNIVSGPDLREARFWIVSGWPTIRQVSSTSLSNVLILILPMHSADVIAIARSQPGGRSIRSILSNHLTVEENKS